MIVVRDVLKIAPEKMKEAKDWAMWMQESGSEQGYNTGRVLTDLVGEYYTLVLETEFENLSEVEPAYEETDSDPEWQERYSRIRGAIRGGHREILTVVDSG